MKAFMSMLCLLLIAGSVSAAELQDELVVIQRQWAHVQYQLPDKDKERAFETLVTDARQLVDHYPGRPEPLIWQGIVLGTYAGARGGLGALGLVKEARKSLEAALAIDERALDGSAHTSLGSLYYQVPGWPLSFGDDSLAEQHLRWALEINPAGIDPNFFFGDYLLEKGDTEQAKGYLQKALLAAPRPGREVADAGRRREISERLDALRGGS
jgi:tetratricopeptide (TPR) repeat protein